MAPLADPAPGVGYARANGAEATGSAAAAAARTHTASRPKLGGVARREG
jgi:hypothetical protein